jgi:hypothetical protein
LLPVHPSSIEGRWLELLNFLIMIKWRLNEMTKKNPIVKDVPRQWHKPYLEPTTIFFENLNLQQIYREHI